MKKLKAFFIRNRKKFIVAVSVVLIIVALISIHFTINVAANSNDECLWIEKKIAKDSIAIFFDYVKVEGVSWEAGIRDGDQLVAINDHTLTGTLMAQRVLNNVDEGEYARYTVKRDGEIFTADVRIKKLFSFPDLAQNLLALIWILIGFVVLMAKPDGTVQKLFYGIGAASVIVSSGVILQSVFLFGKGISNFWAFVLGYFWALSFCFLPFLIIYFFWTFPKPFKFLENKFVKPLIFIIPGILFIITFTIEVLVFVFQTLSFTHFLMVINIIGIITGAAYLLGYVYLAVNYKRLKTKEEKKPVFIILAAYTFVILASLYTTLIAPAITDTIFNSPEYYTPIILIVIFPLAFAYSIFKYQLMDVSVVVRHTITYGAATLTVLVIYFLVVYLLGQTISQAIGTEYQGIIAGAAFIIFAIIFQSTKNKFQDFITEKFYPEQFAYQKVLVNFSNEVSTLIGLDNILDSMKKTYVDSLKLKTFAILLKEQEAGKFRMVRSFGLSVDNLELNAPGLIKFIKDQSIISPNVAVEQNEFSNVFPENAKLLIKENVYTIIPMVIKSKVIGLLFFGLKPSGSQFSGKDIELLSASSTQSATAIENARLYESEAQKDKIERDLELARRIQQGLLPKCIPEMNGLDICGQMVPAQQVGGDYFDLIPISDQKLYVIVGDVSGKGLSASLYMTKLQTMMRLACKTERSPKDILVEINKSFYESIERNWFVTLTLALFDTEKKTVRFCRAGHMPILSAKNGTVNSYKTQGIGLGLEYGLIFERTLIEEEVSLQVGEIYAFFSDGITEAMNEKKDLFGEDKLTELLKDKTSHRSSEIMDIVWNEVKSFRGQTPVNDDMTMVLVKVCSPP
jgi:serine phosphatase RsbU (regulator of sigma subunit)